MEVLGFSFFLSLPHSSRPQTLSLALLILAGDKPHRLCPPLPMLSRPSFSAFTIHQLITLPVLESRINIADHAASLPYLQYLPSKSLESVPLARCGYCPKYGYSCRFFFSSPSHAAFSTHSRAWAYLVDSTPANRQLVCL